MLDVEDAVRAGRALSPLSGLRGVFGATSPGQESGAPRPRSTPAAARLRVDASCYTITGWLGTAGCCAASAGAGAGRPRAPGATYPDGALFRHARRPRAACAAAPARAHSRERRTGKMGGDDGPEPRDPAAPDVRDHQPSGRGQDDADGEAAAVRRRD